MYQSSDAGSPGSPHVITGANTTRRVSRAVCIFKSQADHQTLKVSHDPLASLKKRGALGAKKSGLEAVRLAAQKFRGKGKREVFVDFFANSEKGIEKGEDSGSLRIYEATAEELEEYQLDPNFYPALKQDSLLYERQFEQLLCTARFDVGMDSAIGFRMPFEPNTDRVSSPDRSPQNTESQVQTDEVSPSAKSILLKSSPPSNTQSLGERGQSSVSFSSFPDADAEKEEVHTSVKSKGLSLLPSRSHRTKRETIKQRYYGALGVELLFEVPEDPQASSAEWRSDHKELIRKQQETKRGYAHVVQVIFSSADERDEWFSSFEQIRSALLIQILREDRDASPDDSQQQVMRSASQVEGDLRTAGRWDDGGIGPGGGGSMRQNEFLSPEHELEAAVGPDSIFNKPSPTEFIEKFLDEEDVASSQAKKSKRKKKRKPGEPPNSGIVEVVFAGDKLKKRLVTVTSTETVPTPTSRVLKIGPASTRQRLRGVPTFDLSVPLLLPPVRHERRICHFTLRCRNPSTPEDQRHLLELEMVAKSVDDRTEWLQWFHLMMGVEMEKDESSSSEDPAYVPVHLSSRITGRRKSALRLSEDEDSPEEDLESTGEFVLGQLPVKKIPPQEVVKPVLAEPAHERAYRGAVASPPKEIVGHDLCSQAGPVLEIEGHADDPPLPSAWIRAMTEDFEYVQQSGDSSSDMSDRDPAIDEGGSPPSRPSAFVSSTLRSEGSIANLRIVRELHNREASVSGSFGLPPAELLSAPGATKLLDSAEDARATLKQRLACQSSISSDQGFAAEGAPTNESVTSAMVPLDGVEVQCSEAGTRGICDDPETDRNCFISLQDHIVSIRNRLDSTPTSHTTIGQSLAAKELTASAGLRGTTSPTRSASCSQGSNSAAETPLPSVTHTLFAFPVEIFCVISHGSFVNTPIDQVNGRCVRFVISDDPEFVKDQRRKHLNEVSVFFLWTQEVRELEDKVKPVHRCSHHRHSHHQRSTTGRYLHYRMKLHLQFPQLTNAVLEEAKEQKNQLKRSHEASASVPKMKLLTIDDVLRLTAPDRGRGKHQAAPTLDEVLHSQGEKKPSLKVSMSEDDDETLYCMKLLHSQFPEPLVVEVMCEEDVINLRHACAQQPGI